MKGKLAVALLVAILLSALLPTTGQAQIGIPWGERDRWIGPDFQPPSIPNGRNIQPIPFLPVPLHLQADEVEERPHAVEKHGADAVTAREAHRQQPNCLQLRCVSRNAQYAYDILVVCTLPNTTNVAVRWIHILKGSGKAVEGTSFITNQAYVQKQIRNQACYRIQ